MDFEGSIEVPGDEDLQHWTLKLPPRAGVYLLWGNEGEPILLATSGAVRAAVRRKLQPSEEQPSSRHTQLDKITKGVSWTQANSNFAAYVQFHQLARKLYPQKYRGMLGFKDAWWVKMCLDEPIGRILVTQKISVPGGDEYIGPWPNAKAAKQFVDLATDMYGLCRNYEMLRQINSQKTTKTCSYAQMDKCCGVCLGKISAEQYRELLNEAIGLAERKNRLEKQDQLKKQMSRAAGNLEFEAAANTKALLKRMAELENKNFRWAGSLRRFGFLIIAPGTDRKHIRPWRVKGGLIQAGEPIEPAEVEKQIGGIVDWARQAPERRPASQSDLQQWRECISLVSYFLFRSHSEQCLYYKLDNLPEQTDLVEQINGKFKRDKLFAGQAKKANQASVDLPGRGD